MPETINLKGLLGKNRNVDPKTLEELVNLYKKLLKEGLPRGDYRLLPPNGGRRVVVGEPDAEDSRTKYLSRRTTPVQ